MMNQITSNKILQIIWYSLPIVIIFAMVWLAKSPIFDLHASKLAPAITIDLLLTLPIIYFLIIRKKSIPKTTVVLVLGIGVLTASLILPKDQQWLLGYAKIWVLPFVELFVVTYVFFTIRKSVKAFKINKNGTLDFHTSLKLALKNIMPAKIIPFVSMEISSFYYGFIRWKRLKLNDLEFSYHKETGTRAVLGVLIFLIAIETFAFHILLVNWSPIFAWVLTGLSIYSGFQILGILKSISQRPISVNNEKVILKYGIIGEAEINMSNIDYIVIPKGEINKESGIVSFSPLGDLEGHNLIITLKNSITISGFYGIKKEAKTLALFIDQPNEFMTLIKSNIE